MSESDAIKDMTLSKWWHHLLLTIVVGCLSLAVLVGIAAVLIYPELPALDRLTDYRPKLPLRIYSEDGYLIREFGEEHRTYIGIKDVPQNLKDAVIAIEDRRFYQHHGIDLRGVLRAVVSNLEGGAEEGASTITMQVARNFYLSNDRNFKRKINEAFLAVKIEQSLSKDKILELYLNQIYLGQRAYGFAAASQAYFGKPLDRLNLAEAAMLAGLPKAPSGYNPFLHPRRAIRRQKEVLHDMQRYGFINYETYQDALKQPLHFKISQQSSDLAADYVAEIVRGSLYDKYGDEIYSSGMKVYTTIRKANQEAANAAVMEGILDYDLRHGYRGPEQTLDIEALPSSDKKNTLDPALDDIDEFNGLIPAIITNISPTSVQIHIKDSHDFEITGKGLEFVEKTLKEKDPAKRLLKIGSVVRVLKSGDGWRIVQLPQVESALIALDPKNGAVRALVDGFDFNYNKFNHVTQAWRQPGSSFKPFIYSAALEKGYTPASIVDDAPLNLAEAAGNGKIWSPQNYENTFEGPVRLREALAKSVNLVSIRVLQSIGVNYAQDYITRFGFAASDVPAYPTMALGAGSATPWQMAAAYAVFANGGYRIQPKLIAKIIDQQGNVILTSKFDQAGNGAPRVIDARNAFIMNSMLQSVIRNGTATRALKLGRSDLAGKTGTTNDHFDAWFAGYNPKQVAVAWVGFDKPQTLGRSETGASAALPIWIKYMATTLKGQPDVGGLIADGVVAVKINTATGIHDDNGVGEYFYRENPPPEIEMPLPSSISDNKSSNDAPRSQPQQLLQPEIVLIPRPIKQIDPGPLSLGTHAESTNFTQNQAVKILNPSMNN